MRLTGFVRRALAQVAPGEWIALAIFAVSAWRLKWVADDGYIYLTYVQNLVDLGNGPVFNSGERIEAYTSPLWFGLLSLVSAIVPRSLVELPDIALVLGFALSLLAAALWIPIERAARRPLVAFPRWTVGNLPLAIMAGTYVFRSFATSGLETSLLLVWLGCVVLTIYQREPKVRVLAALAGVAPLVRPDLGIVALVLVVALVVSCRRCPPGRRIVVQLVALIALPLLVTSTVRVWYYAQLAPNTYYAKTDSGHGIADGWNYLLDVTSVYGLAWLVGVAAVALVAGLPRTRSRVGGEVGFVDPIREAVVEDLENEESHHGDPGRREVWSGDDFDRWRTERRALLSALVLVSGGYVILLGGDFMHGRFWITPWVFLLGAVAGVGSDLVGALARRDRFGSRWALGLAAAGTAAVALLHLSMVPAQSRMVEAGSGSIDGIVDEGAFYSAQNPNQHRLGSRNLSPLFERGVVAAEIAQVLGEEIGIAQGAIGQMSFAGQRAGDVYIFDMAGLTQVTGSRVEAIPEGRVGHAKIAPDVLVATNPRVDLFEGIAPQWMPPEASFEYGGYSWRLGNLMLVEPLVEAGIISDGQAAALDEAYAAALAGPVVDANLVTYLTLRAPGDAPYAERLNELAELGEFSGWRRWMRESEASRAVLGTGGCSSGRPFQCLARAIDRHGAATIPRPDDTDMRVVD